MSSIVSVLRSLKNKEGFVSWVANSPLCNFDRFDRASLSYFRNRCVDYGFASEDTPKNLNEDSFNTLVVSIQVYVKLGGHDTTITVPQEKITDAAFRATETSTQSSSVVSDGSNVLTNDAKTSIKPEKCPLEFMDVDSYIDPFSLNDVDGQEEVDHELASDYYVLFEQNAVDDADVLSSEAAITYEDSSTFNDNADDVSMDQNSIDSVSVNGGSAADNATSFDADPNANGDMDPVSTNLNNGTAADEADGKNDDPVDAANAVVCDADSAKDADSKKGRPIMANLIYGLFKNVNALNEENAVALGNLNVSCNESNVFGVLSLIETDLTNACVSLNIGNLIAIDSESFKGVYRIEKEEYIETAYVVDLNKCAVKGDLDDCSNVLNDDNKSACNSRKFMKDAKAAFKQGYDTAKDAFDMYLHDIDEQIGINAKDAHSLIERIKEISKNAGEALENLFNMDFFPRAAYISETIAKYGHIIKLYGSQETADEYFKEGRRLHGIVAKVRELIRKANGYFHKTLGIDVPGSISHRIASAFHVVFGFLKNTAKFAVSIALVPVGFVISAGITIGGCIVKGLYDLYVKIRETIENKGMINDIEEDDEDDTVDTATDYFI